MRLCPLPAFLLLAFYFLFWWCWGLNQRLAFASQALYPVDPYLQSFFALVFRSYTFCLKPWMTILLPKLPMNCDCRYVPPCLACLLRWGLLNILAGWPWTMILPISISQEAGMAHILSIFLLYNYLYLFYFEYMI
jgi:hypothetical protein